MNDDFELIRGSGNVFRDLGRRNAAVEQARAILAARIIRTLDERGLSTREAERRPGVSHSEFSPIRNARLQRFTFDRMIAILGKLDEDVEVNFSFAVEPRRPRPSLSIGMRTAKNPIQTGFTLLETRKQKAA